MIVNVYVPREGSPVVKDIMPRSALVGVEQRVSDGVRVRLDFEGGKYEARMAFEQKLLLAATRHEEKYPTTARLWVKPEELVLVGTYDTKHRTLLVTDLRALDEWRSEV